ncbi:MAG: hypothetical protein ACRD44_08505 [Bryobacteraceae bacterium]
MVKVFYDITSAVAWPGRVPARVPAACQGDLPHTGVMIAGKAADMILPLKD